MANTHFGNLADVFKHLALAEVLGTMRPQEYWESHAGRAFYIEDGAIPEERRHGVHAFRRIAGDFEALRLSLYFRIVSAHATVTPPCIPGSPLLARILIGETVRRLLVCDLEANSLESIRAPLPRVGTESASKDHLEKVECVQDDGISVLRGAGVLLPEPWTGSTLAFLDPYDLGTPTDAGISPLELACELAGRNIASLLFYTFKDETGQSARRQEIARALEKARLLNRGAARFEGSLKRAAAGAPTQWGFGLLALHLRPDALDAVGRKLRALEAAYERVELAGGPAGSGAWRFAQATL